MDRRRSRRLLTGVFDRGRQTLLPVDLLGVYEYVQVAPELLVPLPLENWVAVEKLEPEFLLLSPIEHE
jgi:hypothetical protein